VRIESNLLPDVAEPSRLMTEKEQLEELIRLIDKGRELDINREDELRDDGNQQIISGFMAGSCSLRCIHKRAHQLCQT